MILNVLFFIIKMVLMLSAEFVFFEGWGVRVRIGLLEREG